MHDTITDCLKNNMHCNYIKRITCTLASLYEGGGGNESKKEYKNLNK